ncbi:3-dehydroquinate synthase [Gracilibacillus oryzae]|uniref:3-dehydroquinate synthase n=1 Tax=Gracilibacillus oryzae TaxID=1672701 RepID=A0A7C8GUP8_9BACI|nr:3-dehydroquinate synthase II [Gracilibacillus oryzae]KAB8137672.1 3-dehydroquinate synthase [Gracilibacillus oryzae]
MDSRLQEAEVVAMESIGEGTRVCLDFVDKLQPTEGILVGNTGHGYLLVLAENRTTDTYPARPFRVNAGAIHQYALTDEGKTSYLAELKPGDQIAVMSAEGKKRNIAIGRVKMEKRPFLRIVLKSEGAVISATLQDADSVHVLGHDGSEKQVLDLQQGDRIMIVKDQPGRHLGEKIEEEIIEL